MMQEKQIPLTPRGLELTRLAHWVRSVRQPCPRLPRAPHPAVSTLILSFEFSLTELNNIIRILNSVEKRKYPRCSTPEQYVELIARVLPSVLCSHSTAELRLPWLQRPTRLREHSPRHLRITSQIHTSHPQRG